MSTPTVVSIEVVPVAGYDSITGLFAKDAITAALFAGERIGVGQRVQTSLLESTVATLGMSAYAYLLASVVPSCVGSEHAFIVPWKAFQTSDGYLVIAAGNEGQWQALCRAIGRQDLAADDRFVTMRSRNEHRGELYGILDSIFLEQSTEEWTAALDDAGTAAARVQSIDEVFQDPQVLHRDMLQTVEHATLGEIPQVGHAQKFSGNPATIRTAPPVLGQHTIEVLHDIVGLTDQEIQELCDRDVIYSSDARESAKTVESGAQ